MKNVKDYKCAICGKGHVKLWRPWGYNGPLICAICAAPMILGRKGLLEGKEAICFPGFEDELKGAIISDSFVCKSSNIITAKGMGSAVNFGLEIVKAIKGDEFSDNLRATLQIS